MDFEELQIKFADRHLDTRTKWILGGTQNKEALNDGYKTVYLKVIQSRDVQQVMKTIKTLVTITDKVGTLPVDFLQPVSVYSKSGGMYSQPLDGVENQFRFQRTGGVNKIIFEANQTMPIYIEYIQKLTSLVDNTDEPVLPAEFDNDIINYAMIEYHRAQRDWVEVSNELQYAEGKIGESIDNFWLE